MSQALIDKLTKIVEQQCENAEEKGSSLLSTCHHGKWDREVWDYRETIISGIKRRGYNVSTEFRWGVMDITTTKNIVL